MKLTTTLHAAIKRTYAYMILDGRSDSVTLIRCMQAMEYLAARRQRLAH